MSFVPENGSGVAGATSYVSEADFDTYWEEHPAGSGSLTGEEIIDKESEEKQAALMYATWSIESSWTWDGYRKSTTQGLSWPRTSAYLMPDEIAIDDTIVPDLVTWSVCELAGMYLSSQNANFVLDPEAALKKFKAGALEIEWDRERAPADRVESPIVAGYLARLGHRRGRSSAEIVRS